MKPQFKFSPSDPPVWIFLLLYVLVWVTSQLVSNPNLDPYGDMLENFSWGQSFAWGQAKHPPLVGWITGLWFDFLPQQLISYLLLAYLNVALGLAGVFVMARMLGLASIAGPATLLMMLALPYSTLAAKFNANAILLLVWPWIVVAWLGCVQSHSLRSWLYAVLLGICASLGMLAKYYTGLLLLSLAILTLISGQGRSWLLKPQAWFSLALFCLILTPHWMWLEDNHFITFSYVQSQGSGETNYLQLGKFALAPLGFWLLAYLIMLFVLPLKTWSSVWRAWLPQGRSDKLFWLAVLPYLITLGFGISGFVSLSSPWAIPLGFSFTLLWLRNLTQDYEPSQLARLNQRTKSCLQVFFCAVLLLAPAYAWYQSTTLHKNYYLPTEEAVFNVEALWLDSFAYDYGWVAGDYPSVAAVVFYGSVDANIMPSIPQRPSTSGLIFCHLGALEIGKTESLCTARAERWMRTRQQQVLTNEFTAFKSGPRYIHQVPHLYRVYFYQHQPGFPQR